MKRILFLDTETSGLDPKVDHLIEVGLVLWDVQHRAVLQASSWLVQAPSNAAEHVNGIPAAVLPQGLSRRGIEAQVMGYAADADVIVAHNAEFDRAWLPELANMAWVCSCFDIEWPGRYRAGTIEREGERPGHSLVALCLAHGVGVADAHRALADCLLLARLLERVAELGHDIDAMLARAMRPKVKVVSLAPFERKDEVKAAGFRWDPGAKVWWRTIAAEDVAALPFRCRVVQERAS